MINNKKYNYTNLGSFFRDLPEEHPKLAPLLLYANRPTVANFYKNNNKLTFLIPSDAMMAELKSDFDNKRFKELDLKVLSLIIPDTLHNNTTWHNTEHTVAKTIIPIKTITNKNILFENGSKAILSHKFNCSNGNICFWELEGSNIPVGSFTKKKLPTGAENKPKKGGFENKNQVSIEEKKIIMNCLNKGEFKKLVCELYNSLDTENKQIANCLINGNPAAEFFLLFDSPMIKYDTNIFVNYTFSDKNIDECYNNILNETSEYLCNNFNTDLINKLKEHFGESNHFSNDYERFYTEIESNGEFNLNGDFIKICPPIIGKYMYSIELFCLIIKILHEKLEQASEQEYREIINEMIIMNNMTNQVSTKNLIFDSEYNYVEKFEKFKERFEKTGLCLIKTHKTVTGSSEKKIKPKSRKILKHKNNFKNLSEEHKQKLKKYLLN